MKMTKKVRILFSLLLIIQLFPIFPIFAETVQDVPGDETTISSKAEDPLKGYQEKAQNQASTAESVVSQDVPEVTKESEIEQIEESPATEEPEAVPEKPVRTPRGGGGGIMPLAGNNLVEGLPGDPFPYDIDKNFADVLRADYGAPTPITDDFMEGLFTLDLSNKNLKSLKGLDYAENLTGLYCQNNQLTKLDTSENVALIYLQCNDNQINELDVSTNVNLIQLYCYNNILNELDVSNCVNLSNLNCYNNKLTKLNVKGASSLKTLACGLNELTELDVGQTISLEVILCDYNNIKELNVSGASSLSYLSCNSNALKDIDISKNTELEYFSCPNNLLEELDLNKNSKLTQVDCSSNELSNLDVSENTVLTILRCSNNHLGELDVSKNTLLDQLVCDTNELSDLDVSKNTNLIHIVCSENQLSELDVSKNTLLKWLSCDDNRLSTLNMDQNTNLQFFNCSSNHLTDLDVSKNLSLNELHCSDNQLSTLNISQNTNLNYLFCSSNHLTDLDVSSNLSLNELHCSDNYLMDITSAYGLNNLTILDASMQKISIPVPAVSNEGQVTVDVLKTTDHLGLSAFNRDIVPTPSSITPGGDSITLTGVTRDSLSDKSIEFEYDGDQLAEGANPYTTKKFSGIITFTLVSELKNDLTVNPNRIKTGEQLEWTWVITSLTLKKAEDIRANFSLSNYQLGDISDIEITNKPSNISQPGTINHLDGTISLGDLNQGESIEITFKTVARGNADEWLKGIGKLNWTDNTPSSPHFNESTQEIKVLDEEQSDRPKESADMGILSAPLYFNFGIQNIDSNLKNYSLHSQNYQTNTNVITDGFYTRIKDDRVSMDGWKLSASLSKFMDNTNREMPNGSGATLKLNQMKIERVTDRDTPQEVVDGSPTGPDVPSTVKSSEILIAGDSAKILVNAQANQGGGTWQLRMPFDQISLDIPANAGKKGTIYKAKLTWTLNNTP